MSVKIFPTLKNYKKEYLPKDILSGIIMAAVSIPISMGYAQIAGVPAVYGLYGSVLPILLFAMLSTSKQFIFGVDAAPAAIVGAALATLGVTAESAQALQYVPLIALFTGLWLLLFYLLHADKIVDFISTPVMAIILKYLNDKNIYEKKRRDEMSEFLAVATVHKIIKAIFEENSEHILSTLISTKDILPSFSINRMFNHE